jgi:hypothetical protein
MWLAVAAWLAAAVCASAATGKVIKVLPQLLDLKGRNSLTPSLYERDSYQAHLREHTNLCSGMVFYIQWKTGGQAMAPLKLRVDLRGVAHGNFPKELRLEQTAVPSHWFNSWAQIKLVGKEYKEFGQVTAWRVTLWEGDRQLSEQQSFLW